MSVLHENGVVDLPSSHSVHDTVERVAAALAQAGVTLFAQIDQQAAAAGVGLDMRPMTLLVFGNPRAGTPLMQAYPSLAIDLPLKALVWEAADGSVWVSTNSPAYLQRRHGLAEVAFAGVVTMLERGLG